MKRQKVGVIIGLSKDSVYTIQTAKRLGIYVVGIDGNKEAEGLKHVDKAVVADITDLAVMEQVINEIKPDFAIPVPIGRYLSTTGWVNTKFNLVGASYEATLNSIDKYAFHNKLHENGLRDIKMYLIQPALEDINKEYDMDYPAILKPRYGSGSRSVYYLQNKEELNNQLQHIVGETEDYILEQAAEGIEYSVDGAVINGELKIILLRKKIITPLPIRQPISSFSVVQDAPEFKRVQCKLEKIVKALEYDNCLLNADLIVNEEDIFCIEISPRPSGHNLHSMFVPEATGVDMVQEYIRFLMGEKGEFSPEHINPVQIRFFDFENGIIDKVPTLVELEASGKCHIINWNCQIKEGDYMQKVVDGHSLMGRGFFVVKGDSEEDLIKQSNWVLDQFHMKPKE